MKKIKNKANVQDVNVKPHNIKKTISKLFIYFKPYKIKLMLVVIFAILSTVLAISGPKILGNATNEIVDGYINITVYNKIKENLPENVMMDKLSGDKIISMMPDKIKDKMSNNELNIIKNMDFSKKPTMNFDKILEIILFLVAVYALSALLNYIQSFMITNISQKVTYTIRNKVFNKIEKIPLKYYDTTNHGDILSRVTNDVDVLSSTVSQGLSQTIITITGIIGILIMMLSINVLMTLIALVILPISVTLIGLIMSFSQNYFIKQQEGLGKMNGHVEEMYSGHTIVKAFNNEPKSIEEFKEINQGLYKCVWKSQFFSGLMMPIVQFIGNIGYVAVSVLGGYLVVKNKIKVGDIQAFIQYLRQFTSQTANAASIVSELQSSLAASERIIEFLDVPEEIADKLNAVSKEVVGDVSFNNVKFGYNDKIIINDFSLDIKHGSKVAIVGPTGAGKTTLVKLLMRFYDVNDGSIKIDNIDIRDYKKDSLRNNFGMVLQDTWLFNGTILDNIKYGKINATKEDVENAIKTSRVDHIISTLPEGYNYVLNEEANNLSSGEKQLLTIARAILANPKILILDEATSSVDTRTETLINEAMENLMKDRTSFIIAHRLSTIKNASMIIVMDQGDIKEVGTHKELLNKNGFYAKLYNSQFENEELN
ncbi:MAG: ABC transporter ATP-binding protein [Bacilli bacterium]